ncbi:NADH-ubiquinone oxidoreductase 17.8 kDa subunit, mitochondrial [Erysiphe neolycopersici]|uniref:NADH-ubiquinone oxidoreductase 17.8 kDa subunit, mitochondrial n=1 Tax=Erysiphe neolycopersici TaxID=212602 RepID=A0A420HEA5_9PEZI|nr:NADH-ubiquinone oxidoreductase 17.8 kDa subunit, mitochondrial [Erysiphe neolycopersici]
MNAIKQCQTSFRKCLRFPKSKIDGRSHRNYSSSGEPHDESLGKQFYITLSIIPLSVGLYTLSRPDADGKLPAITRFIDSFSHYKEKWSERNTIHTKAVEQAGYDRNLFNSSTRKRRVVDLKFPEIFNTGSPFNVVAGQGPRNMDVLVAHYTKKNADEEERKLSMLRNKNN